MKRKSKMGLSTKLTDDREIAVYHHKSDGQAGYQFVLKNGAMVTRVALSEEAIEVAYALYNEFRAREELKS